MNKTKKSLLMSAISLLLCISMLIGSTFAWFTDSVTSAGNKIQSGTLKVDLELLDKETGEWNSLKDTKAPIFNYDKWEPGYVDTKVLKVENEGNLALKWVAKFYSEYQLSILADVIDVYVRPSDSEIGYPTDRNLEGYTCVGNLRTFINSIEKTTWGTLEAKEASYLGIALKMREEAGNEYQGLSLGGDFDIRIYATQYTSESDSFGNMYDANTDRPVVLSRSAMLQKGQDSLNINLFHKGAKLLSVSVPADAIADPTKPITVTVDDINPDMSIRDTDNTKLAAYDINVTNLKDNLSGNQLVTVSVSVPNGRAAVNAYHSGNLIEDAVYDDVEGTVTFKTAHFSPFEFTSEEYEASNLAQLREYMNKDGAYVRLNQNITIDLSKDSADRSEDHKTSEKYYNAVNVVKKDVAIDLNGYSITVKCGDAYNSNSDVGALFYVGAEGSLNVCDSIGSGFIKMESSIYAIWAPHDNDASYLNIYGGTFIADSYAGDPIGTSTNPDSSDGTMKNENSNRTLIYAGLGGNINVYGGYFLYNNTPNDVLNRNNGAFNCTNGYEGDTPMITIHEGVMLIDKAYRQDPTYTNEFKNIQNKYPTAKPTDPGIMDNSSIKLEGEDEGLYKVSEVTLATPITIDGKEYSTWYRVSRAYQYTLTFKDADGNDLDKVYIWPSDGEVLVNNKDDTARSKLTGDYASDFGGWANVASDKVERIDADNTKDIVLYPTLEAKYTVRWVDENGNAISSATVKRDTKYSNLTAPSNPKSQYDNMIFDHWEIREKASNDEVTYTAISSNYKITKDITLYPYYTYNAGAGSIALEGHDDDGDGRYDWYSVEAAAGLSGSVTIPGSVNGVPVSIITDLSGDTVNGLSGGGINSVIIKDGVTEISSNAFAGTAGLNYVEVPASVTNIGANAFSSDFGALILKKVTIKYAGTWAEWQAACGGANSNSNWDSGLGDGSKVECSDATYVLKTNWLDSEHTWSDWKKQ